MSVKAARHDLSEQTFSGTPRTPPFVSFCRVPLPGMISNGSSTRWCGEMWVSNNLDEYAVNEGARHTHESLCSARAILMDMKR